MKSGRSKYSLIAAFAFVAVLACDVRFLAQGAEHWVATWATEQTLSRGAAAGAGAGITTSAATAPASGVPTPPSTPTSQLGNRGTGSPGPARRFPVPPVLAGVSDQTIRMVVRTSVAGRRVRVRFTNAFAGASVRIGAARVARSTGGSAIDPATSRALTFSGQPVATMFAGQVLVSDPIDLAVPALTDLAVSVYVQNAPGQPTEHRFALRTTYVSEIGDFTNAASIEKPRVSTESWYWLSGVDVLAPIASGTIVAFGDSITDGDQSTTGTHGSWPSVLARRLQADSRTRHLAVVNAGISGNRVLGDNTSALVRFGAHALDVTGVRWVTILEGINDITAATRPGAPASAFSADDLIVAYQMMIARARAQGVRVAGCTITPYGGSTVFSQAGEEIRQAVNRWIRTSGAFDAVIDFDAAVRDPGDPSRMKPEADSPDLLHPGDAGYRLMAETIDLGIFTGANRAR